MTSDCPTAEFVGSSWRRDQHARRGSQHCMHCHSAVNARDCTSSHCHSTSNTRAARPHTATRRRAYGLHALTLPLDVERTETVRSGPSGSAGHAGLHAQGRVAVPPTLPLDGERTGCTPSHCHSTSNVPKQCAQGRVAVRVRVAARSGPSGSAAHTATRRRTYRNGASRAEWQCRPRGAARSGPSGSATHTATRRRTYGLHAPALPLDVERTETVRSGPSGGAGSGGLRASSRCADARTHLQDVSRASGSWALFETDPLRAVERLLARQVGMAVQLASPM